MRAGVVGANPRVGRLFIALAVGVLILGVAQLGSARVDFLPEFMPPSVQVQTEALGLSAAEVEQLITVPLEQDLLNGVPWLDRIHSRSQPGLSAIDIVFEPGTDIYAARQMVQERLTQAHALPNVGSPPIMVEPLASVSRVAMIGLQSTTVSLIDMSVLARWKIRPRLMGIPGVANVSIYGPARPAAPGAGRPREAARQGRHPHPGHRDSRQRAVGLAADLRGGVDTGDRRVHRGHEPAPRRPARAADHHGRQPRPGLDRGHRRHPCGSATSRRSSRTTSPSSATRWTATPTLFLVIQKFPDADTMTVTKNVEEAMESLAPGLKGIQADTSVYRPASLPRERTRHRGAGQRTRLRCASARGAAALLVVACSPGHRRLRLGVDRRHPLPALPDQHDPDHDDPRSASSPRWC